MAKVCGIYGIQNTITGEWYIGQSMDIAKRHRAHLRNLESGKHENEHLQRAFNKYGAEGFTFSVLEECPSAELDAKEIAWITEKDAHKHGYNMTDGGGGIRGHHFSEEVRKKMSVSHKGQPVSEEQRQKMRLAKSGEKHHQWGKPIPEETKSKISNTLKGDGCFWFGKNRSQAVKDAISRANKGKAPCNRRAVRCVETGKVYESIRSAAIAVGKSAATLSEARKYGKTCGGYHWEYCEEVSA